VITRACGTPQAVEGAVGDALAERIEAGMREEDSPARWFLESVCRDFPAQHGMASAPLTVREEPLRIIDAFPFFNEIGLPPARPRLLPPA
jgi:hypothetical protein